MITRLYTLFLGLLFALFIGVGIAAFYHAPTAPNYPTSNADVKDPTFQSAEDLKYQERNRIYETQRKLYDRNVSLLVLAGAILLVTLGLTVLKGVVIINDSLLLGGVFTLIYSIMRGFGAGDDGFRFILVTTSLGVAIILGYVKLIVPMNHQSSTKKRK
jgi:hypothetical protein